MNKQPQVVPPSPINAAMVATAAHRLSQLNYQPQGLYWLEHFPERGGKQQLRRLHAEQLQDVTNDTINIRSRVHEYGGGDYCLSSDGACFYVAADDQAIYRLANSSAVPQRLTPLLEDTESRYSDMQITSDHRWLISVHECHLANKVINNLVAVATDGSQQVKVLAEGCDFYSSPTLSHDGRYLAWLQWNHPHMPWDCCELLYAELTEQGELINHQRVTAMESESIYQPGFDQQGNLYFVSDRTGWWQLYRYQLSSRTTTPVLKQPPEVMEFAYPQWILGTKTWQIVDEKTIIAIGTHLAKQYLVLIKQGSYQILSSDYDCIEPYLAVTQEAIYFIGANSYSLPAIVRYDLVTKAECVVHCSGELSVDKAYISQPQSISFTSQADKAYGFYYPPQYPGYDASSTKKPPLIVLAHGGPTANTNTALNLSIQFFTSRGFAVMDVNYRGSTGYGRAYRQALHGQWGVVDVQDCVAAANYLVEHHKVDKNRLIIKGKSSGGLTVLGALAFHQVFKAGVSFYGVVDLLSLLDDTHKFESHYLDQLIGPGNDPQTHQRCQARSPLQHANNIQVPVLFLQGLKDHVVPPSQAEAMIAAMEKNNVPYTYITFPEEGHGFRQSNSICQALESELTFYAKYLDNGV